MTARVSFVGAGPGAADLITVRAVRRIELADVVVCTANPLAPDWVRDNVRGDAEVIDSTRLGNDDTLEIYRRAAREKLVVAVVVPGDPALWGDVRAHFDFCVRLGIDTEIVPGVTPMSGAVASVGRELSSPDGILLARPRGEGAGRELAGHAGTLALELPAARAAMLADEMMAAGSGVDTPVLVGYKVSQPGEVLVETTLGELAAAVKRHRLWRQALFLIGPAVGAGGGRARTTTAAPRSRSTRWSATARGAVRGSEAVVADDPEQPRARTPRPAGEGRVDIPQARDTSPDEQGDDHGVGESAAESTVDAEGGSRTSGARVSQAARRAGSGRSDASRRSVTRSVVKGGSGTVSSPGGPSSPDGVPDSSAESVHNGESTAGGSEELMLDGMPSDRRRRGRTRGGVLSPGATERTGEGARKAAAATGDSTVEAVDRGRNADSSGRSNNAGQACGTTTEPVEAGASGRAVEPEASRPGGGDAESTRAADSTTSTDLGKPARQAGSTGINAGSPKTVETAGSGNNAKVADGSGEVAGIAGKNTETLKVGESTDKAGPGDSARGAEAAGNNARSSTTVEQAGSEAGGALGNDAESSSAAGSVSDTAVAGGDSGKSSAGVETAESVGSGDAADDAESDEASREDDSVASGEAIGSAGKAAESPGAGSGSAEDDQSAEDTVRTNGAVKTDGTVKPGGNAKISGKPNGAKVNGAKANGAKSRKKRPTTA